MRLLALSLGVSLGGVSVAGCEQGKDPDDYPVLPGSGGGAGQGTPPPDAGGDGESDAGMPITRRVCVLSDARAELVDASCAANAQDYLVTLGSAMTLTDTDGTFMIAAPTTTGLVWQVETGISVVPLAPSLTQFGPGPLVPAITAQLFEEMIVASSAVQDTDTGSIFLAVVDDTGNPVEDVLVTSVATLEPVRGDDDDVLVWPPGTTGPAGRVWLTSVNPTDVFVTVNLDPPGADTPAVDIEIPVAPNAVTFARYAFD